MPESGVRATAARPLSSWVAAAAVRTVRARIGVFSQWQRYRHLGTDEALNQGQLHARRQAGVRLRVAEARPSSRASHPTCGRRQVPRERSPVTVSVDIDGVNVLTRQRAAVRPVEGWRLGGLPAPGGAGTRAAPDGAAERRRARRRRPLIDARPPYRSVRVRCWSSISTPRRAASHSDEYAHNGKSRAARRVRAHGAAYRLHARRLHAAAVDTASAVWRVPGCGWGWQRWSARACFRYC